MNIHVGCWTRNIPGFINVDLVDLPHIHHKRNIDDLSVFEDNSADLIYSSHNFEYFDRVDAKRVLAEWRRVLKPGGLLRLAVPDFEKLIHIYQQTGDIHKILGPLFGRMGIHTSTGDQTIYHKTVYDFNSLKLLLEESGFGNVRRYDWRETIHRNYDDHSQAYFPHMDKENGILLSLNIETNKL
jgi:predicted SAM-dependent methyltransferase